MSVSKNSKIPDAVNNKCPFSYFIGSSQNSNSSYQPSFLAKINYYGMKYLKYLWIFQYFGTVYPGVIAHFSGKNILDQILFGHKKSFHKRTVIEGKSASTYFLESGIHDFAIKNNGICTFRMGFQTAIYQNKNIPIVDDEYLAPSTDQNRNLFGDFMGTLPVESKNRKVKRAAIESTLGTLSFMQSIEDKIINNINIILEKYEKRTIDLEIFCREIVGDLDSLVDGILDFKIKPLSYYFNHTNYKDITVEFFDIASDVISKLDTQASTKFDTISNFVRAVLTDNYKSIKLAPDTNVVKRYFKLWGIEFSKESIEILSDNLLKELGTIIVAIYDTSSLSLSWAISYIEQDQSIKKRVIEDSQNQINPKKLSYIDFVIFEAIRLGGSNPTALWRKVIKQFELEIGKNKIIVLPGTMLWLDRRNANKDYDLFPDAQKFNPQNIQSIMKSDDESISSIMSKNRYELNSFSMVNTNNNPRKCPARVFSVYIQSLIIRLLYNNYCVTLTNNNNELKDFCAMPKQSSPGTIKIRKILN
jgi:hypothetical protein